MDEGDPNGAAPRPDTSAVESTDAVAAKADVSGAEAETPVAGAADEAAPAVAAAAPGKRRGRGRKILLRTALVFVVIIGLALIGGTYYYDNVALPESIVMEQTTSIYYADGATLMGRIGDTNRTNLAISDIPVDVQHAVVAAQDETFYSNSGVDYGAMAGAAWNQVAGDGHDGGSTISQQYARHWADLEGVSYARKLRESVIATKLNDEYSKDKILELYLNVIYFGRGSYGIQAAAQAYFGKPAKDLTLAEGIVLAGLIDNPEGNLGKGSPFDPTVDAAQAHARFDDIKQRLVKLKFVGSGDDPKLTYPGKVLTAAEARKNTVTVLGAFDGPEGLIIHHVLGEVAALTDPKTGTRLYEQTAEDGHRSFDKIRNGGLKIVTTIDKTAQQIAVREASRNAESNLNGQPINLQAALVAVEPGTGAVKAYYGGDRGSGGDYAGYSTDPVLGNGEDSCCGGHPPGTSFGAYTLAAGLMAGYSIDSYWNGESPQQFPNAGRTLRNNNPVKNAGEDPVAAPACKSGSPRWCTLEEATVLSLNTTAFAVANIVGPAKVIDTAGAAGITDMWAFVDGKTKKIDVVKNKGADVFPKYFNTEVGFGQYPVTVLDQAAGMATFAARGIATRAHFLKEVWTDGKKTFGEVVNPKRIPGFTEPMADDLTTVLQGVPKHYGLKTHDDRPLAGLAGAWQFGQTTSMANAWMVGYSAADPVAKSGGLAVAVWVGNKEQEQKIVDKDGRPITGGTLPGAIWRDFLDDTLTALHAPVVAFPAKQSTGSKNVGTGVSPTP